MRNVTGKTSSWGAILLAGASMVVLASPAMAQDADEEETAAEGENVIVVSGIRASIESATNAKRNSDQIKDVIDAEDVGKLPDTNVAESLQRVTGVQINRELGEGSEIAVRGFSQNRVEVNGQTQVGAGATGGVTYQTVTSEAFKSIEVIKTPAADEIEGALGAIVRFNTRKPLDSKRDLLSVAADAQYAERADAWTPNFNVLASTQTTTGEGTRLGALFNFTYKGRKLRQDFLDIRGWDAVDGFGRDLDGDGTSGELIERDADGIITNLQDGAYVPLQTRLQIREQDRDLYSGTLSLQAKTDNGFELYLDSTYTLNEANDTQFQYTSAFNSALEGPASGMSIRPVYQDPAGALISPDQTVLSAMLGQVNSRNGRAQRGVNLNIAGNSAPVRQQVWTLSSGFNWQMSNNLEMKFNFARGQGWQENDQVFTTSGVAFNEWPFYFYDFSQDTDIPTLIPLVRELNGQAVTQVSDDARVDLLDLSTYNLGNGVYQLQQERNKETAWRLDFDWDVDLGPISSIQFGGRLSKEHAFRFRDRAQDTNTTSDDGILGGLSFADLETLFPGIIVQQPYGDVLGGASGDFPREWFSLDSNYIAANLSNILAVGGINRVRDQGWGFDVSRETQAAYVKFNYAFDLGGVEAFGNFGMRYVNTDRSATGGVDAGNNVFIPLTVDASYDNWLPSFNFVADMGGGYYARFGAAKAMARPRLIDLAPLTNVQFFAGAGTGGNPYLEPEKVFQLDLSFEKYFSKSNLVSAALFYKDFSQRIEGGIGLDCFSLPPNEVDTSPGEAQDGCPVGQDLIRVNKPVNAGSAKVKGVELAWQQSLDFLPSPLDGLGFIANYTFIDADKASRSPTGRLLPVQDLSKHSYNLIGYYEKYGITARVAYNWRSSFYDDRSSTNQASFAEPYGQLDASLGYDVTPKLSINVEAINILNEAEIRYQEIRERLLGYRVNDRRLLLGVRWKM